MKRLPLILLALLLSGCSTTLKQQWYDFNAYYNTFYNAKNYFQAGLEADRSDRPEINPNDLIRIHPPPSGRGNAEFAVAIEKSADIIRRHPRSRYVHDAVELIGRSYFYRGEFFSAQEKFRELYRNSPDPGQRVQAVIWEGRSYLELGMYSEGIRFLEEHMAGIETASLSRPEIGLNPGHGWSPVRLAEARAVLAQLYTFRGEHYLAGLQLLFALDDLHETELAPRVYFHYGQLMELMENLDQAASAFAAIRTLRVPLHLEYHARIREADILRKRGSIGRALAELQVMEREENYGRWRQETRYEMARVYLSDERVGSAEKLLREILEDDRPVAGPAVRARSYHQLAEIHRIHHGNHLLAAAYYDSAASVRVEPEQLPDGWEAPELAEAWGEYAQVQTEIVRMDSLLALSRLPDGEFETRIREIVEEVRRERMDRDEPQTVWESVDGGEEPDFGITTDEERGGFLAVDQPEQQMRAAERFRAVWGDRSLRDNWRRASAPAGLQPLAVQREAAGMTQQHGLPVQPDPEAAIDLSEIPRDPERRADMERRLSEYRYRLGNIYMIRLQMPQEAEEQFLMVRDQDSAEASRNLALYALAEIALERGDRGLAHRRALELIELAPESPQAVRIAERTGLNTGRRPTVSDTTELRPVGADEPPGSESTIDPYDPPDPDVPPVAISDREHPLPPEIGDTTGADSEAVTRQVEERLAEIRSRPSADDPEWVAGRLMEEAISAVREARSDTLYEWRQQEWQQLGEAGRDTLDADQVAEIYPYRGVQWDLARELLAQIVDHHAQSRVHRQAELLLAELHQPPQYASPGQQPDPEINPESEQDFGSGQNPDPEPGSDPASIPDLDSSQDSEQEYRPEPGRASEPH